MPPTETKTELFADTCTLSLSHVGCHQSSSPGVSVLVYTCSCTSGLDESGSEGGQEAPFGFCDTENFSFFLPLTGRIV